MLRRFEVPMRISRAISKMLYMTCCRSRDIVCMRNDSHRITGQEDVVAREEMLEPITV